MRRSVLVLIVLAVTALAAGSTSYADSSGAARQAPSRGVKHVPVPQAARAVDTSHPDHVIGNGTPSSCTSRKVVRAVARGGVITFRCGPDPVVIAIGGDQFELAAPDQPTDEPADEPPDAAA